MEKLNPFGYLSDYDIMDLMEFLSQKLKKSRFIYFRGDFFDYKGDYLSDIRRYSFFPEDREANPKRLEKLKKIAERIVDEIFDDGNEKIQLAKLTLHKITTEIKEKEVKNVAEIG